MAQVTVILQSTLSDWKTTAQAAINANFTEVYAVTDKIDAATTPNPGDVLTWNTGIGQYEPQAPSSGGINDGDTLSTGLTFPNTGLHILDTDASHDLILKTGSNLTADRTLTITTGDSDRTLTLSGNADISGTNTGDQTSVSGNAGTATTLQTARKINGVSFDGSADIITENLINIISDLGGSIKSQPWFGGIEITTANGTLTNQRLYCVSTKILKDETITGIAWQQVVNGNYTPNNNNRIGLCTYSGGTLTLVASCANDGNLWQPGSSGFKKKAFTTPYSASAGLYFIVALYCRSAETTAPQIQFGPNIASALITLDFTNSAKLQGNQDSQTDLMATTLATTSITALSQAPKFWTY